MQLYGHIPWEGGWNTDIYQPSSRVLIESTLAKLAGSIQQKDIWQIHFTVKMQSTTFDQMNLAFSWFEEIGYYELMKWLIEEHVIYTNAGKQLS